MNKYFVLLSLMGAFLVTSCAEVAVPDARNVNIPTPVSADKRRNAINERPDSVMYLPLGDDVLVPARISGDGMPDEQVGPFELRGETLAGALQLILSDYDIAIAFETEEGLSRQVTVANLKGDLDKVVGRVCSLADLYCSYEDETLIVKDTETFTVTLPPLASAEGGSEFIDDVIQGLSAVLGEGTTPVSDPTTRTIIYTATARTSKLAENYFQRLRANTAMIVFETYIWEVSLNSGNSTGIDYSFSESFDKFTAGIDINGGVGANFTNPVSIGLPQTIGADPADMIEFLSQFGAVKTISQPQITVLSGAEAELRIADTENFVSEVTSTISGDQTSTSVSTDSVDSGFTLTIDSSWDKSTVYANININLTNVVTIDDFTFSDSGANGTDTIIQLPQTTERELTTQIRVRPGDSVLIGGLVQETDNFDSSGPGFMEPVLPSSRTATTQNLELVVLLRPRVVVYTDNDDPRYVGFIKDKQDAVDKKVSARAVDKGNRIALENKLNRATIAPVPPVTTSPIAKAIPPVPKQVETVSKAVMPPRNVVSKPIEPYESISPKATPSQRTTPQVTQPVIVDTAPETVIQIDSHGANVSKPLSPEVFNNAKSLNVYEAFEKSRNSYYSQ